MGYNSKTGKNSTGNPTIQVRLSAEERKRFRAKCKKMGISAPEQIRQWIDGMINPATQQD